MRAGRCKRRKIIEVEGQDRGWDRGCLEGIGWVGGGGVG